MTREQEHNLKALAADCAQQTQTAGATLGGYAGTDGPCRVSLQERISNRLRKAVQESRRAQHLAELQQLLERNPETARILDLVEEFRD